MWTDLPPSSWWVWHLLKVKYSEKSKIGTMPAVLGRISNPDDILIGLPKAYLPPNFHPNRAIQRRVINKNLQNTPYFGPLYLKSEFFDLNQIFYVS